MHECLLCGKPATKRCGGCSSVSYCSVVCQKTNWANHKVSCNPKKYATTADYLAAAVKDNVFPDHPETCRDYGFTKAFTMEDRVNLLGLYIGLIERMGIKAKEIHSWRVGGTLVKNIHEAFSALLPGQRGGYYPWFVKNQWVLENDASRPGEVPAEEMRSRGWVYAGGNKNDSQPAISAKVATWPDSQQLCLGLCTLLLSGTHPPPNMKIWLKFGFCTCKDEQDESELAKTYIALMNKCPFSEIHDAFSTSSLISLFDAHGLEAQRKRFTYLEDILSNESMKSVWHLKRAATSADCPVNLPVGVDYGFANCKSEDERVKLMKVYRHFFEIPHASPVELHKACLEGKLYEFAVAHAELKKRDRKIMRHLMKNMYPLADDQ